MLTAAVLVFAWSVSVGIPPRAPRPVRAAQTNSYSTLGTVSYDGGSCGVDEPAGVVSAPGIKKILKISNTEIYVVGCFLNFAGVASADYVAKWDGSSWSGLGSSGDINKIVHDAVMYKGSLHIAGEFENAGGDITADMVAKWNGSAWVGLAVAGATAGSNGTGSPKDAFGTTDFAAALKVQENGAGTSDDVLLVGGRFLNGINDGTCGGCTLANTRNIAKWNGATWGSLDSDSDPYSSNTQTDYVVHDIEIVGGSTYIGGYRNNSTFSATNKLYLFHKFNGTNWSRPAFAVSQANFGTGFGVYTMEAVGTNILLGGTFTGLNNLADHMALYDTTSGTFSVYNSFSAVFGNGAVVRTITSVGSQLFVGGSFPGVTGTSGGVARWTGSSWQGIGRNSPAVVNALLADMSYSGSDSRVFIGSSSTNIGGVAAADGLAALAIDAVSTLDSVTVNAGSLSPAFNPAVTTYSLSIPNASASVDFTVLASSSGAAIKRTNSFGTLAMSSDVETLNVAVGATESISFAVNGVSGASATTYTFNVTREAATTTSAASTTAAPTTATPTTAAPTTAAPATTAPPSSVVSQTTSPATTEAPATTAPATTAPLAASGSGATVSVAVAPVVSAKKAATGSSIAKYAKITVASGARITLKVATSSAKYCRVSGTSLKGVKAGSCRVTVTVTPKSGKAVSKTVTLKVT